MISKYFVFCFYVRGSCYTILFSVFMLGFMICNFVLCFFMLGVHDIIQIFSFSFSVCVSIFCH